MADAPTMPQQLAAAFKTGTPSKLVLDSKGLVLSPGELSRAPGALTQADNINVEAPGIMRSRNGFARQTNGFGGPAWKFISTKALGNNLLLNYGSASAASGLKIGDGSSSSTPIKDTAAVVAGTGSASVVNLPPHRMQALVAQRNHYLTSGTGVRRLETNSVLFHAGMPKSLGFDLTGPTATLVGGAGGFLPDFGAVAYRVTWCKKDQEGIEMEGAPSSRVVIYNKTGTTGYSGGVAQNVLCRIRLPFENGTQAVPLTTAYYFKLYRSEISVPATTGEALPSDDMQLVYEQFLTSGDISTGYVDVTDATPDVFRQLTGDPLYTNKAIEGGDEGPATLSDEKFISGVTMANNPPPYAADCVLFSECAFYANLLYRNRLEFTLLSVAAGAGLTAGDTFTLTPALGYTAFVMTAIAPGTPAAGEFVVYQASTASENIERTLMSLVEAINKYASNDSVWAYYTPKPSGFGAITLEARLSGGLDFNLVASAHGTAYRPQLGTAVSGLPDSFSNGIAYSKPSQADAVPPINLLFIGRADTSIQKMLVLRDSIYIFSDSGLYRLDGRTQDDFSINEFELSFRLIGPELAVVCDDAIFAWGVEGIARITSAGVEYISNSIEPLVQSTVNTVGLAWLGSYAWAVAYRSSHKVLFWVPSSASDSNAGNSPIALVFDTRMQAWTRWLMSAGSDGNRTTGHSCGAVRISDDVLFMGQWNAAGSDSKIFKERRSYTAADFADDTYNTDTQAITKTVKWSACTSSPEVSTHWDEVHLFYDVSPVFTSWTTPTALTVLFISDFASTSAPSTVSPTVASRMSRATVAREQRRSARLQVVVGHSTVSEYFGLEGMALVHLMGEGNATVRT